jgi:6-pyruvoyltetrahydropterin/6-carboxytetrahydropterin synthase
MFSVTKRFKIPIGHRLTKHKGRCSSYHGHNIRIDITVQRDQLNENDMVIDFYDLKALVGATIDNWDHSMILNHADINSFTLAETSEKQRIVMLALGDPTSENMCFVLFNLLCEKFTLVDPKLRLKSVVIWESDESFAKYEV